MILERARGCHIARGLFDSVANRFIEMDTLTGRMIMTEGVAASTRIVAGFFSAVRDRGADCASPAIKGAVGAALYALTRKGGAF